MGGFGVNLNTSGLGLGGGIDVQATVNQLVQAARAPEQVLTQQQQLSNSQTSALQNLNSLLSSLQTAVNALQDPGGQLNARATTSSDTAVASASANAGAALGTHTITVDGLAAVSSYYTGALASADTTFGTGQFTLQVGTGQPVTVTVDSSNNTLNALTAYINSQNLGVTANVISDSNGSRLSLVSNTSGAPGDLNISGNTTGLSFTKSVTGTNASFTVDGVPLSSTTNSVTTALPGVTLNLAGISTAPVSVSVTPDTNQATAAVNSFVSAYNAVVQAVNAQFTYAPGATQQPPLFDDNTLAQVQQILATDINYAIPGSNGPGNLATFGVNLQQDGTLSVDTNTLNNAITGSFSSLQSFFQSTSPNGFAVNFSNDLANLTNPTAGALYIDLQGVSQSQAALTQEINDFEANLAIKQQTWIQQFSQVNAILQTLPVILAQISSQLGSPMGSSTTL